MKLPEEIDDLNEPATRLAALLKTGIVDKQKFVLFEPITIACDNVLIKDCHFVFRGVLPEDATSWITLVGDHTALVNNYFDFDTEKKCDKK